MSLYVDADKFVSVIVPVYNAKNTIEKCVKSILDGEHKNLECVLVNDGSTDGSGKICDELAKLDRRVVVLHKENGGVSSARNLGIKNANGKYVTFVDSDDEISLDYIKSMCEHDCELVCAGQTSIMKSELRKTIFTNEEQQYNVNRENTLKLLQGAWLSYICTKLFVTDVIRKNDIALDEDLCFAEDTLFVIKYMMCINRVKIITNCGYYYTVNEQGTSLSKVFSRRKVESGLISTRRIDTQIKEKFGEGGADVTQTRFLYIYENAILSCAVLGTDMKFAQRCAFVREMYKSREYKQSKKSGISVYSKKLRFLFALRMPFLIVGLASLARGLRKLMGKV